MHRLGLLVVVCLSLVLISGCENEKEAKLFKAQICLDKANVGAEAAACYQPIVNETSKRAYVLICSGRFLERGLNDDKIVAALKEISDDDGTDPTETAITNLAFPNDANNPTSYDVTFAQETFNNYCINTESDGLIALASFAVLSTAAANLVQNLGSLSAACQAQGAEMTVACIKEGLDELDETANAEIIGEIAVENQEAFCGEKGIFKEEEFCTDLEEAVNKPGNNNNDAVGDTLLCLIDAETPAERAACP